MARRGAVASLAREKRERRSVRQRGNHRSEQILEVALRLFAEQGYTAVSIKDIARASRINSALIYYYFTNKEHLFVEALRYSADTAATHQQQSRDFRDDPVAEINFWFDANAKLAKPLGQMLRLMLDYRTSRKRSASIERLITDFYEAEMGVLRRAIDRGIKRGVFGSVDTVKTSLFVSTHLDGLMVAAAVRPDYDLPAGLRQMRKILLAYLGYVGTAARPRKSGSRTGKLRVVA